MLANTIAFTPRRKCHPVS